MLTIAIMITSMAACFGSVVLDPALYLGPSPPLLETSDSISPEELWLQPLEARTERVAREALETTSQPRKPLAVETGRMFWPRYSTPQTSLGINIPLTFSLSGSYGKPAVPPTGLIGNSYTSVTGLSGALVPSSTNLRSNVGSLTSSISNLSPNIPSIGFSLGSSQSGTGSLYGGYGRSALAGSGYGSYGLGGRVRIYGGDNTASWSGWGNGKWGHYGKG